MTTTARPVARALHRDDIAVWPDGEWASMDEIWRGDFAWKSDDFEIIDHTDARRLRDAGILDEIV